MSLYQDVRDVRDGKKSNAELATIWNTLKAEFNDDWLCALEIFELLNSNDIDANLKSEVYQYLNQLAANKKEFSKLINDGLALCGAEVEHA